MGWVHLSVLHLKKKNHISSRHELMRSVRTKRSEASHVPGVLTSLIQPECECVQVIVFNCGDDLMGFFSVLSIHLWSCTLWPLTQPGSVSLTSDISCQNLSAISHFVSQRQTPPPPLIPQLFSGQVLFSGLCSFCRGHMAQSQFPPFRPYHYRFVHGHVG